MDEEKKKTFAEQISSVLNGTFPKKDTLEVRGETPFILRQVGFKNLPMHTAQRHIIAALNNKDEKKHWHGLSLDTLTELPNFFDSPVMIMDSISPNEDAKNSIVVVTDKFDSDGLPIIASVQPDGEGRCNSIRLNSNFITSVYGKDRFANFIARNLEENSILYIDKEKSQALYRDLRLQLPQGLYNLDFDTIIRKSNAFVNREEEKKTETTEKNEGSMKADTNNATAQSARERVQQIRDEMVKTLLEHIEKNPTDWQSGWSYIAAGAPYNGKTNTAYRGMNALYLAFLGAARGYKDTRWVTFNQAKELGASVKKGEKSAPVIFFEFYDRATKKAFDNRTVKDMTEEEKAAYLKENVYAVMKYTSVFNAEQCHNFPERKDVAMPEEERAKQNIKIEAIIANSAAPVRYDGGTRAYYSPGTDSIHLPKIEAFDSMQDYYATALHEIAHSTGHESRLKRDLSGGFGSESYAKEELRAELACVFMQMEQGIQLNGKHITNHAAYLNSWLEAAKKDTSVFFKAAADAQKIADYVADNYLQAADVAVTTDENVAQEQTEEQPERNPMAEYMRATQPDIVENDVGEHSWEQENIRDWYTSAYPNDEAGLAIHPNATFRDLREEVNRPNPVSVYGMLGEDSVVRERAFARLAELSGSTYASIYSAFLGETAQQKLENARALAQRLAAETGEPHVTIEWSEHKELNSYDVMSLSEADKKLAALDAEGSEKGFGYDKTKLHIDYVFEGEHSSYECCRFDIGTEGGGLVHHIEEFLKYDTLLGAEERQGAEAALKYFKVHTDLSAMVDTAIASNLPLQEQFDVQSYVLAARKAVNSAVPFSTYKLPDMSADESREAQADEQATDSNQRYYYPIDEEAARRAKEANSFSDYKEDSATAEYRRSVDSAIEIATKQKALVDPMYHERIDALLASYAKHLAANINEGNVIDARMPSYLITGGGNFNIGKKQKQNAARDRNHQEWQEIQGILDKIRSTGKGGISSDDPDSIQKLTAKLEGLEKSQETMKAVNTYYRKNKTLDGCPELTTEQIAELKADMRRFPHLEGKPYPTWALSNNNAEIRRVKDRIEELTKRQKGGFVGWEFNGGEVKANTADNRLQIFFEEKPDEGTRSELKHNGFKWSPKANAWQRQLNENAYRASDRIDAIKPLSGEKPTDLQRAYIRQHSADVAGNSVQGDLSSEQEKLIDDAASWYSMERPQLKLQDCLDDVRQMDAETIREYAEKYRAYLDFSSEFLNDESEQTNYNYSASDIINAWRKNVQVEESKKEKTTLEEARNAMLDAQVKDIHHFAVRAETITHVDPIDGYESEQPANSYYVIDNYGRVVHWQTLPHWQTPMMPYEFNGIREYEEVTYEELEEIAHKMRAPIEEYKAVLRAEKEQTEERKRSDAYYEQRAMDILEEHYKAGEGAFERNIENPRYLNGTLYATETRNGYKVINITKDSNDRNIAIIKRNNDYIVAANYDTDDGTWAQGFYGFENQKAAEEFRAEKYGAENIVNAATDKITTVNERCVFDFKIDYSNELLISNELKKLGLTRDFSVEQENFKRDEQGFEAGLPYWMNDIKYTGENGKELNGTFGKINKGVLIENADITRFTAQGLSQNEIEQLADVLRSFDKNMTLKSEKVQGMANNKNEKAIAEELYGKSVWLKINLPENAVGGQYGNNTLVRMPDGEFSHFGVFVPSKFIKNDNGKVQLNVGSKFTYRLTNDGREVNLTGQELADSFAGKTIGKEIVRVAPSRKYAQTLANLEKNVPTELKEIPTWCCYRTKWNEEKGKKDKFIISPMDGKWASSKEPNRWTTFEAALKYARENNCEGLSLLLDKQYGITCIDLDKCITDAQTGAMKERATKLVKELEDTYIERSTSGNGVHIFLKDDILKNGTYNNTSMVKDDNPKGDIEVFDDKRIISMTGDMLSANNNLTRARSAATLYLRQELGERRQQTVSGAKPQTHGSANLSDKELIQWIQKSKQGNKFNDLYSGKGVSGDRSGDDGKLAHMLLYFNGGDKEQAFRIMRESGLNRTDKPDSYYRHTIDKMNDKISEYAKRPSLGAPKQQNKSVAGKGKPGAQA